MSRRWYAGRRHRASAEIRAAENLKQKKEAAEKKLSPTPVAAPHHPNPAPPKTGGFIKYGAAVSHDKASSVAKANTKSKQ